MSIERLKDLREKRGLAVAAARTIVDKVAAEKRGMTADETAQYDTAIKEQDGLRHTIEALERQVELDKQTAVNEERQERDRHAENRGNETKEQKEMRGFRAFIVGNRAGVTEEFRALQADVDPSGGYLVLPQQFVNEIITFAKDESIIRQKATVYPLTSAASLGVPTLDTDPADADWTTEILTGSEDSSMAFGKRELKPHPLAKLIKASRTLLRISAINPEALLRDRLGYKFGISEEKGFMTGTGAAQPLGVFTASSAGITTARDVAFASTTAIGADDLINMLYSVKAVYQKAGEWVFHRDAVKQLAKLKDGDGQYIWRPGLTSAQPDTLLNRPLNMSEYAPNTFTTGKYCGLFGVLKYYWIADALDMQIQRLDELYAATNQVGFIGRKETDGMPVLAEAFARGKLA